MKMCMSMFYNWNKEKITIEENNMVIAICDDEEVIRHKCSKICKELISNYNRSFEIIQYEDGKAIDREDIDILILDIEMPIVDGLSVKEMLQNKGIDTYIIFVTSHDELMPEAFGKNVIGFTTKNLLDNQLKKILEKTIKIASQNIIIEGIDSKYITYIQADNVYCMVHLKDGTHKLVRSGIGNIAKQIEGSGLYKINKSYIINFEYLDKINEKTVEVDGVSLPLSVRLRKAIKDEYRKYCRRNARFLNGRN